MEKRHRPKKRKIHIDPSPEAFEGAFYHRLGQTPTGWVKTKVENGSPLDSIQYLFELNADAIAKQYYCCPQPFDVYYKKYLKTKEVKPVAKSLRRAGKPALLIRSRMRSILQCWMRN